MGWWLPTSVTFTHLPTGIKARSNCAHGDRYHKSVARKHVQALNLLKAKLAKLKEDPSWVEGNGPRVRSYHFNPYLGIEPFVQIERGSGPHLVADLVRHLVGFKLEVKDARA